MPPLLISPARHSMCTPELVSNLLLFCNSMGVSEAETPLVRASLLGRIPRECEFFCVSALLRNGLWETGVPSVY